MAASALPYRSMKSIDDRLEGAATKPVIVPENIICAAGAPLQGTMRGLVSRLAPLPGNLAIDDQVKGSGQAPGC